MPRKFTMLNRTVSLTGSTIAVTFCALVTQAAANSLEQANNGWQTTITGPTGAAFTSHTDQAQGHTKARTRIARGTSGHQTVGIASYYWQGQMTASGQPFNKRAMTAAHRTLPFGTQVRVTRPDTGKSVVVTINDRGPFKRGRIIDLSEKAAEQLRMKSAGVVRVQLQVLR